MNRKFRRKCRQSWTRMLLHVLAATCCVLLLFLARLPSVRSADSGTTHSNHRPEPALEIGPPPTHSFPVSNLIPPEIPFLHHSSSSSSRIPSIPSLDTLATDSLFTLSAFDRSGSSLHTESPPAHSTRSSSSSSLVFSQPNAPRSSSSSSFLVTSGQQSTVPRSSSPNSVSSISSSSPSSPLAPFTTSALVSSLSSSSFSNSTSPSSLPITSVAPKPTNRPSTSRTSSNRSSSRSGSRSSGARSPSSGSSRKPSNRVATSKPNKSQQTTPVTSGSTNTPTTLTSSSFVSSSPSPKPIKPIKSPNHATSSPATTQSTPFSIDSSSSSTTDASASSSSTPEFKLASTDSSQESGFIRIHASSISPDSNVVDDDSIDLPPKDPNDHEASLLDSVSSPVIDPRPHYENEIQRLDGWNNNLGHLSWGSSESQLSRKVASNYADGVYMIDESLPSARLLSEALMRGEDGLSSSRNLTTMFALFGQVVSSEVLMASESGCPIERHDIRIKKCDPMYDRGCVGGRYMPFHRAMYDPNTGQSPNAPREQLNLVTSWIDGSFVYSTYEAWLNQMRSFRNGTLRVDHQTGYPPRNTQRVPLTNSPPAHHIKMISPERMFLLGDARTNQNPALLSFSILLYRWHNVLAARVQANKPHWNDEDVFQRARRLLVASLQNIFLYEYLPILIDEPVPKYEGYKPDLHPGISHVFQTSAFRFGHTMIPPGLYMRDAQCNFKKSRRGYDGLRLCASWWNSDQILSEIRMEELLMGLSSQIAEREDAILCSDVRDKLFGPMDFSRRDLAALNIMRGRDSGLADYNSIREAFGLKRLYWTEILPPRVREADRKRGPKISFDSDSDTIKETASNGETSIRYDVDEDPNDGKLPSLEYPPDFESFSPLEKRLYRLYRGDLNTIDVYVGGMMESDPEEGRPGPLFRKIILEQFLRLRDADRFWFENTANGIFSEPEIGKIRQIRLWDILVNASEIPPDAIQREVFQFGADSPCPQPQQISSKILEPCVILAGWDYFHGSEITYVLVILLLIIIPIAIALAAYGTIKMQNRVRRQTKAKQETVIFGKNYDKLYVREWLRPHHKRFVKVRIGPDAALYTISRKNEMLRKLDFGKVQHLVVEITTDSSHKPMLLIRSPRDHDLVLQFANSGSQKKFLNRLEHFLFNHKKTLELIHTYKDVMLANAETKEKRQKRLEHFFREAYAITFGLKSQADTRLSSGEKIGVAGGPSESKSDDVIMVMRTSLSKQEFAEALGMKIDSLFVKQMFNCVDKDNDGRISFQEFLDTVVLFTRGKTDDKLRIIFDMCDYNGNGVIDKTELTKMLISLVDIARTNSMSEEQVKDLIEQIFAESGLQDKSELTYADFQSMMSEHRSNFMAIGLELKGAKRNFLATNSPLSRMTSFQLSGEPEAPVGPLRAQWNAWITTLEENRQQIVYLLVFFSVCIMLFAERYLTYSFLNEHQDLRHVMGPFIALTRGSAASLSFCYALILLTMSRNLLTRLRDTCLHQYIPIDSHVAFHKIVAMTALFFSLLHAIGHLVNFFHISQQSHEHLKCLGIFFHSDAKPGFAHYIFYTVPGATGLALYALVCLIFIFAHQKVRSKAFAHFWSVHQLYVVFYALTLLHGMAKLTGSPRFWIFFIVPAIIFTFDKVISLQTRYMELDILHTELLPSDVTYVKFARPPNFKYLSGQWVRLACTGFRRNEYHAFTLTSAPHDAHLSVHVKAHGVWTNKLRAYFHPTNQLRLAQTQAKIRLEGPFGGGNQDWYKYEIAVMIGGGIGVTPYASILNDLVFGTSTNRYSGVMCKKVYFLWVCPSHKHFEWFIDVLRDVENKDVTQVLEIHIFITQFFHKFDLRTTMLYICENHFQRVSNKSMFTGLKAVNHFGRPDLIAFLKFIQKKHSYVSKIGVFSCGPTALTQTITTACESVNTKRKLPYFLHQFENF